MNRIKVIVIAAIIIALAGVGYYISTVNDREGIQVTETAQQKEILYSGEDGKSVCDILKANYEVDVTESSLGEMVNSINGLASSDSEFWLYSVNGVSGEVSCDQQMTTSSDTVLWEYKGF